MRERQTVHLLLDVRVESGAAFPTRAVNEDQLRDRESRASPGHTRFVHTTCTERLGDKLMAIVIKCADVISQPVTTKVLEALVPSSSARGTASLSNLERISLRAIEVESGGTEPEPRIIVLGSMRGLASRGHVVGTIPGRDNGDTNRTTSGAIQSAAASLLPGNKLAIAGPGRNGWLTPERDNNFARSIRPVLARSSSTAGRGRGSGSVGSRSAGSSAVLTNGLTATDGVSSTSRFTAEGTGSGLAGAGLSRHVPTGATDAGLTSEIASAGRTSCTALGGSIPVGHCMRHGEEQGEDEKGALEDHDDEVEGWMFAGG